MNTKSRNKKSVRLLSVLSVAIASTFVAGAAGAASMNVGSRSFQKLCPKHTKGDREFNGNGPYVAQFVGLKKDPTGMVAMLDIEGRWRETKGDVTSAEYWQTHVLGYTPNGAKFTKIWAPDERGNFAWRNWETTGYYDAYINAYTDTDHAADVFYPSVPPDDSFAKAWWLDKVELKGDTKGNDVGNCTNDDAYMSVFLPAIWLWY